MSQSRCRPLHDRRLDGARLTVPRACRAAFSAEATLSADLAGCVLLTPPGVWDQVLADLQGLSAHSHLALDLFRFYAASAVTVPLDNRGRLQIPDIHLQWAGLEPGGAVLVVAAGQTAHIWRPDRLALRLEAANEEIQAMNARHMREQLSLVVSTRDWDRHQRGGPSRAKP